MQLLDESSEMQVGKQSDSVRSLFLTPKNFLRTLSTDSAPYLCVNYASCLKSPMPRKSMEKVQQDSIILHKYFFIITACVYKSLISDVFCPLYSRVIDIRLEHGNIS